ncbi:MAG: zinc-dependent peptidase [Gammaproteobacteria bacterium]|nr:zinc-dependent peptidase [Gammaproteobacteria bacterium]
MFGFKAWRRRRLLKRAVLSEQSWRTTLERAPVLHGLGPEERARLREQVILFLHEKSIQGAAGVGVTGAMRLAIAAQACLPILALGIEYYDGWTTVIVYPEQFRPRHVYTDEIGIVHHTRHALAGESWLRGPMVLSWRDVAQSALEAERGANLIVHECAHKLDMLNGRANGMPPLHPGMRVADWTRDFTAAYDALRGQIDTGVDPVLDPYAAESPAEFFAVASEVFFTRPDILSQAFPTVYAQLQAFYRQDTLKRLVVN